MNGWSYRIVRFGKADFGLCEVMYSGEDPERDVCALGPRILKAESAQQVIRDLKEMLGDVTTLSVLDSGKVKEPGDQPLLSEGQFHFPFYMPPLPDVDTGDRRLSTIRSRTESEHDAREGSETAPGQTQLVQAN